MRIALDVSSAVRPEATGVAIYIRQLVKALALVDAGDAFTLLHRFSRLRHYGNFVRAPGPNFRTKLLLEGLHPFLGRHVDVFHGLDARLPGPWMKARLVVTVFDIFSALQSTEFAPDGFRALKAERYRDLVARADRIIVISEACRRDVLETLKPDPARLRVVHLAAGVDAVPSAAGEIHAVRAKHGLEGPYLLYVGTLNKRKNVPAMVRAFSIAREQARSDAVLAIAGRVGYGGETIREAIAAAGPGVVPTAPVSRLHASAVSGKKTERGVSIPELG
jgi:glycosyltransferase involved in cell wall biosynthesis